MGGGSGAPVPTVPWDLIHRDDLLCLILISNKNIPQMPQCWQG